MTFFKGIWNKSKPFCRGVIKLFSFIFKFPALFWMLVFILMLIFVLMAKLFGYSNAFTETVTKACNEITSSKDANLWDN